MFICHATCSFVYGGRQIPLCRFHNTYYSQVQFPHLQITWLINSMTTSQINWPCNDMGVPLITILSDFPILPRSCNVPPVLLHRLIASNHVAITSNAVITSKDPLYDHIDNVFKNYAISQLTACLSLAKDEGTASKILLGG